MIVQAALTEPGPIGGDGFAFPAGTCNLIKPDDLLCHDGSVVQAPHDSTHAPRLLRLAPRY